MSKPPNIDGFDQLNFIVNYMWQGCTPPFLLMVQFAKEPAKDLMLVLLTPDFDDLVKDWLRPNAKRFSTPARRGRKRNYLDALTDPYASVNQKARSLGDGIYKGITLPGAKALFKITDHIDRVNWSAFVLESVTNIGFQALLGAVNYDNSNCPGLGYYHREYNDWGVLGGAGAYNIPIQTGSLLGAQNFFTTGGPSGRYLYGPWQQSASATFMGETDAGMRNLSIACRNPSTGEVFAESGAINLEKGEVATLSVSGDIPASTESQVVMRFTSGFIKQGPSTFMGWGDPIF